jgi:succinylglutamate desuccinylase
MKIKKNKDYILLKSNVPGKFSVVFAGVHGNEICGLEAIKKIIRDIKIKTGSVLFVFGNPKAIENKVRFTDYNLNRAFMDPSCYSNEIKNTYEFLRAQELKKFLKEADVLLDVHSSFSKKSEPFIICEENGNFLVKFFPKEFNKIVYGFNKFHPGSTDNYMNLNKKVGICIECGSNFETNTVDLAEKTILLFLTLMGNIDGEILSDDYTKKYIRINKLYYTKTNNFVLNKEFADFEELDEGYKIGKDGEEEIIIKKKSMILFARNRNKIGEEAFLLAELI